MLFYLLLFLLIITIGIVLRSYHLFYPIISTQDTGFIPAFAKNMAEYGIVKSSFLPIRNYFANTGIITYHSSHPPLVHIGLALSFMTFGVNEAVYRLFNILTGGVLSATFLYLLLSYKLNRKVAIWSVVFWAVIPSGAYFERMYSMHIQAISMIIMMLFFFFKFSENPRLIYGIPLGLSCLLGALTDTSFQFVFPLLIIYCFIKRSHIRLSLIVAGFSAVILCAYLIYSQLTFSTNGIFSAISLSNTTVNWLAYAKLKLEPYKIFNVQYFARVYRLFLLHFTEISLIILGLSIFIVVRKTFNKDNFEWYITLPLLLIAPAVIYITLVAHNTLGHIWTLYWFLPALSCFFGISMDYCFSKNKWFYYLLGLSLVVALIIFAIPNFYKLHSPSDYKIANVRVGQLISIFSEEAQYALMDNYDTIAYYSDIPISEHRGRERIAEDYFKDDPKNQEESPSFIVYNQSSFINRVQGKKRFHEFEKFEEYLITQGYHPWLNNPIKGWTNVQTDRLFLFLDQYIIPDEASHDDNLKINDSYFVCKNNLLRGFFHMHKKGGTVKTIFKDIEITENIDKFFFSVIARYTFPYKKITPIHYKIELNNKNNHVILAEGMINSSQFPEHHSVDISKYSGQRFDFIFSSEVENSNKDIFLFWSEPRLISENFIPKKTFDICQQPDIYYIKPKPFIYDRLGFSDKWFSPKFP